MELGCDLFIEKPMALSVEDCERAVATPDGPGAPRPSTT
jgi:predicted dehydrogenase